MTFPSGLTHAPIAAFPPQMPVMDGIEATRRWREMEAERFAAAVEISSSGILEAEHVYIIAVTAHATAEDRREWCARSGTTGGVDAVVSMVVFVHWDRNSD